ncbi:hypothetical protein [Archangium sp. Cb G35]|uniref:hypothetical protein n=1 Tax=Archangium sp. Cb G35 TaxID=1920190 RepID=UPI001E3404D4|nr:hypothetical protein [Archangium sp. Cb G35]
MSPMPAADAPVVPSAHGQPVAPRFQVHAYPLALRLVSSLLQVLMRADLLCASALVVAGTFTGAMNPKPPALAGWLVLIALGLFGLNWLIRWLSAATFSIEPSQFVLERRGDRFEIPVASVESARVWRLPLPGAGLSLRMKSGRGFQYELQVADPLPVLDTMGKEADHPLTAFAHARATVMRQRWYYLALKFVLFPLVPGIIMFQLNQRITFGGPFAQYRMYGLWPYLQSFFTYWAYFTALLVLFASIWRVLAELVAFAGAWFSPRQAGGVRRFVEVANTVLYYGGFCSLVAWKFLQ